MNNLFKQSDSPPSSGSSAPEKQQFRDRKLADTAIEQAHFKPSEATYTEKAAVLKSEMVANSQQKQIDKLAGINSLDWKNLPPPMLASMLVQIPFKGSGTDPDYFLAPVQAMIFAMRCYELGLSPFSNEVWFNPKSNKINVTFEGKLKLARMAGMKLSPPRFERIPAKGPLEAYRCEMDSPTGKCEYTAYLKDWQVSSSPVWKAKPEHMLQLRAAEKCLSFATGSGASELPDDRDLETGKEVATVLPEIEVRP
jgi:hypothetical protein